MPCYVESGASHQACFNGTCKKRFKKVYKYKKVKSKARKLTSINLTT